MVLSIAWKYFEISVIFRLFRIFSQLGADYRFARRLILFGISILGGLIVFIVLMLGLSIVVVASIYEAPTPRPSAVVWSPSGISILGLSVYKTPTPRPSAVVWSPSGISILGAFILFVVVISRTASWFCPQRENISKKGRIFRVFLYFSQLGAVYVSRTFIKMSFLLIAYTICNLKPICYQEHLHNSSKCSFKKRIFWKIDQLWPQFLCWRSRDIENLTGNISKEQSFI